MAYAAFEGSFQMSTGAYYHTYWYRKSTEQDPGTCTEMFTIRRDKTVVTTY